MGCAESLVYIVDDDVLVRRALARLVGAAGYSARMFASAEEFLETHDPERGGCLILDLAMPDIGGLALQEKLNQLGSRLPVIFLTGCGSIPLSVHAMKAGALTFLTKPVAAHALTAAVLEAIGVDTAQRRTRTEHLMARERVASLTRREKQVLQHIIEGRLNKQIAGALGTVEQTIKVHRSRVMRKMKTRSVAELVRLAACAASDGTEAHHVRTNAIPQ